MDKQTLEDIRQIIVNEYLNKKDKISKDEINGEIGSCRATELRTKLIGMMTAVETIQREIKKLEQDKHIKIKLYNWNVYSGNGAVADGSVFADNEFEAIDKVKQKYDSEYLKVEIQHGEEEGMVEDNEVNGLYVRWED